MYFAYIIKSSSTLRYYVGCTDNITRRVKEHNVGQSKYTRNKGPWEIKYYEEFETLSGARKRERQIKSWKKRLMIEKLIEGAFV